MVEEQSPPEEEILPEEETEKSQTMQEIPPEQIISPENIPISLTVEVAKLKISLEKLLQLKPGNVLEMTVRPEQGVNLTVDGKCVGKGELLQIGEVLGVKITEIGH